MTSPHGQSLSPAEVASDFAARSLERVRATVRVHLSPEDATVYLFGSRAGGNAHRRSDIDVGYVPNRPIPRSRIQRLRDALDALNLPYVIDLVDLSETSETFRVEALRGAIPWND